MRLINYDFHDIYALLVYFRSNASQIYKYTNAIEDLISYLETPMTDNIILFNTVRNIVRNHMNEKVEGLEWLFVDNEYSALTSIVKEEYAYCVMTRILKEMLEYCDDKDRIFLLCDATHNIPLILSKSLSYVKKPQKEISTMIAYYRKQYDKSFLKKELSDWKQESILMKR